jgi:DNA-binding LacI/PurR family transcriptional regulator
MHDVARLAGVSHQTVSRVINDLPVVAEQTRSRVLLAMAQLEYQPNSAARALVTGRSKTFGIITTASTLYGPTSTLYGVEAAARGRDYRVVVTTVDEVTSPRTALTSLRQQGVAGVVVIAAVRAVGDALADLAGDLPLVVVEGSPDISLTTVRVDQGAGARLATDHLLGLGHRTVWHVSGPGGWYETEERVGGWRAALHEADREVPPLLHGDWSAASGYEAGRVLAKTVGAGAIFVANDQMALGVLRALHEAGRRVPEDVSIVGFDDVPEAAFFTPPLTTVRQPFDLVGRRSVECLLDLANGVTPATERVMLAPELVIRDSATRPGSATRA